MSEDDITAVKEWAVKSKVNSATVEVLLKDGFDSLEAIGLLEDGDLDSSKELKKLVTGQRKLLLKAVKSLQGSSAPVASPTMTPSTRHPQEPSVEQQSHPVLPDDRFVNSLLDGLASQGVTASSQRMQQCQQPWSDPQMYLHAAAGKMPDTKYYDIIDFIRRSNRTEEVLLDSSEAAQLIFRSGASKPKLETVSICEWAIANIAIMYRLSEDGLLSGVSNMLDYQSYTVRVFELFQRFQHSSVLLFDREYRKLQAKNNFRWGTDVGHHLQSVLLVPKGISNSSIQNKGVNNTYNISKPKGRGPATKDGHTICIKYNSHAGCNFRDCKFQHVCSVPGCGDTHTKLSHNQKN
jgi:hypothetical protein